MQPIMAVVLVLALVGIAMIPGLLARSRMKGVMEGLVASRLAQTLRLHLVAGGPEFDYGNPFSAPGRVRLTMGDYVTHIESRLEGAPDGYPTRLSYLHHLERTVSSTLLEKQVKTKGHTDCRFAVATRGPFPVFEILSRAQVQPGGMERELALDDCSTGNAAVDAKYQVFTNDPTIAATLAPVLAQFDELATSSGVHVVGDGSNVAFVMRETKSPLMGSALQSAIALQRAMTELAKAVGG